MVAVSWLLRLQTVYNTLSYPRTNDYRVYYNYLCTYTKRLRQIFFRFYHIIRAPISYKLHYQDTPHPQQPCQDLLRICLLKP